MVKFLTVVLLVWFASKEASHSVGSSPSCYFVHERKQSVETYPRERTSEVTTKCGGELTKMADLVHNRADKFGTVNELELVLARGAGLFVDATPRYAQMKWMGEYICADHLNELSRRWDAKEWMRHLRQRKRNGVKRDICGITTHEREVEERARYLTKEQAEKYLHHNHRLFHVGIPICPYHAESIDKLPSVPEKAEVTESDEKMDIDFDETNEDLEDDSRMELQSAFAAFAEKAKVKGVCPTLDFGTFARDTKMRRVYAMKRLVKLIVSLIAPNDEGELMRMYKESFIPKMWRDSSETKLAKVFEMVAEQYEKTVDRKSREIILSSIVNVIGLRELQNYIPGISSRKYHNAKIRARSTVPIKEPVIKRTRYDPIKINYFVSFITSALVSTGLPYGERKVKTTDGTSLSIPNTIRLHRNAEILRMFKKSMADRGKSHMTLSDSAMNGILKKCSATRRHALTCIDYYLSLGYDAFEDIIDILNTLQGSALLDADMAKLWKYNVEQAKLYLRTDFRMHLKMESKVVDHCYLHALSDTTTPAFKYTGLMHPHIIRCPRCAMMESTFNEITSLLESLYGNMDYSHPSKKNINEMMIRMETNVENIMSMKKHLVRAGFTDLERARIIENLNDGEAMVTMDFAQKFLAMYKYESQQKYFGKRGMTWHVFHVLGKINGIYVQHSMIHDNHAVVQMLDQVLEKLKLVKITGIHIRRAYHSHGTIASLPKLVEDHGVKVLSVSFSEAQTGKSSCDRVAGQVKRKLHDYVDRGNDIKNEKMLFDGIAASGLEGLSVYRATITREKTEEAEKALSKTLHPKMDGISDYGHFAFNGKDVRVWKMNNIGEGRVYKDLRGYKRKLTVHDEGGFLPSRESAEADETMMKKGENPTRFWTAYLTKKGTVEEEEPDDIDEIGSHGQETHGGTVNGLFTCPQCGATFLKYGNLLRHIELGRHRIRPERIHLYDYALQLFKQSLEDIQVHNNILAEVSEAMTDLANGEDRSSEEGWALKGKRKRVVYSEKAKKFAQKLFHEGDKTGRKMDPAEVERLMKEEDSIKPYERMNAQQIRSFFTGLCNAKKSAIIRPRRATLPELEDNEEDCEDLSEEDEENIDDFGREKDDVIHDIILENMNDLFENPQEAFIDADV